MKKEDNERMRDTLISGDFAVWIEIMNQVGVYGVDL